jgi:hypothetical protein
MAGASGAAGTSGMAGIISRSGIAVTSPWCPDLAQPFNAFAVLVN